MTATLTATCWPFEMTDDPKALQLLSMAEDAEPDSDPLIPALSPLAAIHARDAFRDLKGAVAEGWLLRYSTDGPDHAIGAADDHILSVLFRLRSGQRACAGCTVRATSLAEVRSVTECPLASHRQNRLSAVRSAA